MAKSAAQLLYGPVLVVCTIELMTISLLQLCGGEFLMGSFRRHLYDQHDHMSRTAYQEMFPNADMSLPNWTCRICNSGIRWVRDNIFNHLRVHNVGMDEYQAQYGGVETPSPLPPAQQTVASPPPARGTAHANRPWYNRCKWTCLLCSKSFSSGFWRHVNEVHFVKKEEYLRDYGRQGIEIVHYSCRICGRRTAWSGAAINSHMKTEHQLSLKQYESLYEKPVQDEGQSPGRDQEPADLQSQDLALASIAQEAQNTTSDQDQIIGQKIGQGSFSQTGQLVRHAGPGWHVGQDGPVLSKTAGEKWFNGCEYSCQLCSRQLYSVAGLSMHLREAHNMEKHEYFQQFGRAGITIRKYTCKICGQSFAWTGVSLSKHVKQTHHITLAQYTAR